jgi:hypothetical protein
VDSIGWFIATLHTLTGHDAAADLIGAARGDHAACLICQYENDPTDARRAAVVHALSPTSIGTPENTP